MPICTGASGSLHLPEHITMKKEHQIGVLIHSKSPQKTPFLPVTHTRKGVTTSGAHGCSSFKNQNESVTVQPLAKRRRGQKQDTRKMDLLQKKTKHEGSFKRSRNADGEPKMAHV